MPRRFLVSLVLIALLLSMGAAQGDKSYSADRFDVDVAAQYDRSLLVEESVTFRFRGGPFSFVFRELPTDHTDGITDIVASVDGVPWPAGTGPNQVEITGNNPIVVTWHLSPTSDAAHTFDLSYRALGVVRMGEEADVLDWQALPDEYEYDIASSTVMVSYPDGATRQGEPEVLAGKADATAGDGQVFFTQGNLSAGDPLVVRLNFAPGSFDAAPPAWQAQREAQNSRAWIWIAAAVATVLGGVLAAVAATRPFQQPAPRTTSYLHKPPSDLPPALAGFLFNQTVSWQHGLATLFDLAGRGLIRIEELGEKKWYRSSDFLVTLLERPSGLRPHEQALLDLLFTDKSGTPGSEVTLSEMGKRVTSSRWKEFTETVEREADVSGFVDSKAKARGKQLLIWGVVVMFLPLAMLVPLFLFDDLFGLWPLLWIGAVFVAGFIILIAGMTISPLSRNAARLRADFDPFRRFVQDAAKGKLDVPDPAYYEAYLPYATAFGQAEPWVKRQARSDYQNVPSYFRALGGGGAEMGAFVAVIAAANSSGGAASASAGAGAAGAGAAGGGASGAG
ncbi:DUF2207 domain-containing protein [Promineifilum sp.]|uniref:DUF2207 family protein n=1 Tax=Promineifilum sp. TaxID=2664178 RepID=UPI0035AE61B5